MFNCHISHWGKQFVGFLQPEFLVVGQKSGYLSELLGRLGQKCDFNQQTWGFSELRHLGIFSLEQLGV
jgi:hypothetical protein